MHFQNKGNLTEGPVRQHLVRLTIPMVWGIAAMISFQLVDMFYIAQLGEQQLTAISYTFPVTYFIFCLGMGFSIAMSSVLSRLIGESARHDTVRVASQGLVLVFVAGILVSLAGLIFLDPIFMFLGAAPDMIFLIREYMVVWLGFSVFLSLPLAANASIRATGDTVSPAVIMCTAAVLNAILAPFLIYGWLGLPRLEMQGAAIATVFSNICALLAGLYVLSARKKILSTTPLLKFHLFWDTAKRLFLIALPAGLTQGILPLVNAYIISLLSVYGAGPVAAFGIVTRVEAFAFIILMALAVGMAPMVGQNWGAGLYDRVREALRLSIRFNVSWSLFTAVVLFFLAGKVAGLFSQDPAVVEYVVLYFRIVSFTYVFGNLIQGWGSVFNAIGKPQRSFVMIAGKMVVLIIPAVYLGHIFYEIKGIFIALAAVNIVTGIGFHLWSWRSFRFK